MPSADSLDVDILEELLHDRGLEHLRVRRRGARLTIVSPSSGGTADKHARLTALPRQEWALEFADHRGNWTPTPFVGELRDLVATMVEQFPWVLGTDP